MNIIELQQQIFQTIKSRLSADSSLADEIAGLLNISTDSAYRRMRGEKQITFEELYKLSSHYRISLDQLLNIETGSFQFQGNILDSKTFRFDAYLKNVMNSVAYINSFKEKEFYYLCKDSPIFHHFYFKELAAFKYYFWMCTLIYFPEFRNKKVDFEEYPDELFQMGQKVLHMYDEMDSVEIWNIENLNTTLRQIEFYRDGQMFKSDSDVFRVYEALEKYLDHIEKQAELGYKFKQGDPERKPMGKFRMYFNEVVLGDNHMLAVVDGSKIAFIPHSAINIIMTRDVNYCDKFHQYLQNLMRRSTLISEVSEKERSKFFHVLKERILRRKESLRL
jgi:hypothetical protein